MAEQVRLLADVQDPLQQERLALAGATDDVENGTSVADLARRETQDEDHETQIKRDFVIKVYMILAFQILLTAALVAVCMYVPAVGKVAEGMFFRWNPSVGTWLLSMLYFIPCIVVLIALFMKGDEYPTNFFLLVLFTALMAFPVGGACYQMNATGQGDAILTALGLTAVVFFAITAYVSCTKFSNTTMFFLQAFLFSVLQINILLGFFALIFNWPLGIWMYNVLGVVIFSGYILFDTWLILQVPMEKVDTGVAIHGAVRLYLDILNLFLHLLQLLKRR